MIIKNFLLSEIRNKIFKLIIQENQFHMNNIDLEKNFPGRPIIK
jgi:hypothetical protein